MEYFSRFMAVIMLIILSPLFLLISCLSLVFQGNPVLYKQERIGFAYHPFMLVKFRSMIKNNGNNKITNAGDNRITLCGKLLRTLKLDELPQLWNIVKGDIHFVGYRPEVPEIVNSFPQYFSLSASLAKCVTHHVVDHIPSVSDRSLCSVCWHKTTRFLEKTSVFNFVVKVRRSGWNLKKSCDWRCRNTLLHYHSL